MTALLKITTGTHNDFLRPNSSPAISQHRNMKKKQELQMTIQTRFRHAGARSFTRLSSKGKEESKVSANGEFSWEEFRLCKVPLEMMNRPTMMCISNMDKNMEREMVQQSRGEHNPKVMRTKTSCMNLFAIRFSFMREEEEKASLSGMEDSSFLFCSRFIKSCSSFATQ